MTTPQQVAKKYIGQTEKPGNSGFNDEAFEKKMRAVGFQTGQAWCAYFTELVMKEAYPEKFKELDALFKPGAVDTFKSFFKAGKYPVASIPQPGALAIWQHYKDGKPTPQGHAGIVYQVISQSSFVSIEGNTNNDGGREGFIVAMKTRAITTTRNGLQLLGFVLI